MISMPGMLMKYSSVLIRVTCLLFSENMQREQWIQYHSSKGRETVKRSPGDVPSSRDICHLPSGPDSECRGAG